jgi:hypothetical protein
MSSKPKRPRDPNQLAKLMVDIATGEVAEPAPSPEKSMKDPAAVALGRRGGLKGGRARAKKLSANELSLIGKKGASARWHGKGAP